MEQRKNVKTGPLFVVIAGVCWGIIGLFSKTLSAYGYSPLQITFLRSAVTAVALGGYLGIFQREKLKINPKDLWMFLGTGIVSIVFFNICYFLSIEEASLSVAAILLYTAPMIVLVLSVLLFQEPLTKRKIGALVLAFIGCVLTTGILTGYQDGVTTLGILAGLGAGAGYAMYTIFGNMALKKYHPYTVTFYTFLVASVTLLPFCDFPICMEGLGKTPSVLWAALFLGIVSTLLPFLCYTRGLTLMEAGKASIMAFIEPMVATLLGIIVYREEITIYGALGIFLIFSSVFLLNKKEV